jgi:hypothetical protein
MILIQRQSRRLQGSTIGNKKRERSSFQSEKFAFDIGELWCSTGHSSQALVAEQIVGKKGRAAASTPHDEDDVFGDDFAAAKVGFFSQVNSELCTSLINAAVATFRQLRTKRKKKSICPSS